MNNPAGKLPLTLPGGFFILLKSDQLVLVEVLKKLFLLKKQIMIQRIQSLYLTVTVILCATLFALPFAEIATNGSVYLFNSKGISLDGVVQQSGVFVVIVIALIAVLHLISIFSYKNRMLQKKIVLVGMISLLGLFGLLFYYSYFSFTGAKISFQTGFIFPLIAIIIDYLAIRGIDKDEALIRSIDRIR